MSEPDWSDFTEAAFRDLIRQLNAGGYRYLRYGQSSVGRQVLWRHDVDFSMHRAAKLAAIETEEGAIATYFVNPHCIFYNLAEPAVADLVRTILDLGHDIGLHFDAGAYPADQWTTPRLEQAVERERTLLEQIIGRPVAAMSWHNPDLSNLLEFQEDTVGGLINAYGRALREGWTYASDSNGYWRFRPMAEVVAEGHERLHLLTHPAWWTPEPMSPSDRIDRCIAGRARAVRAEYDAGLRAGGRVNLGKAP